MRCIYLRIEDFVADRIINLCNKQHITMYRLAQISGLKQSTISNIMKRGTLPNLITLEKICIGFWDYNVAVFSGKRGMSEFNDTAEGNY